MSTVHTKLDPLLYPDEATDHIHGPASAPVAVIEYGDFECPVCRQAHGALDSCSTATGAPSRKRSRLLVIT